MLDLRTLFGFQPDIELKADDEWERGPSIHQDRLTEPVRYAPPRRDWTREPPSQAGMYFCRVPGAPRSSWVFVDVWREHGVWMGGWHHLDPMPIPREGLEWSGPVLEPR